MKQAMTRLAITTTVAFTLAGCTQTSPPTDAIDSFTAMADKDGDIETMLEVQTVLSSKYTATDDLWNFRSPSKGIKGLAFGAPSALKASGKVRLKGRTFRSAGVPYFIGMAQADTAASVFATATQSVPVVLMGEVQNLPTTSITYQKIEGVVVSSFKPNKLSDQDITLFKLASGKPGVGIAFNGPDVASSSLKTTNLKPMAGERNTKLNGTMKIQQTQLGPIGTLEGYTATDDLWKFKSAVFVGFITPESGQDLFK